MRLFIAAFSAALLSPGLEAVHLQDRTANVAVSGHILCPQRLEPSATDAQHEMRGAARRPMLYGLAIEGRRAFLVTVKDVFTADISTDGTFTNLTRIVDDLPEAGQHANRTIAMVRTSSCMSRSAARATSAMRARRRMRRS
jgi:glucose/arabinose dehydrogenase